MLSIEFTTELGAKVSVQVEDESKLLNTQRHYGRLGWTSGEVPAGGYQFPLENEHDFDWSLIGARKWTSPEGEELIIYRGHTYRRRELEAVDSRKMKLPAAIKYSRGAKVGDPPHVREKADGEIEYVALAIFRGGKRQERYAVSKQQPNRLAAPPERPQEAQQEEAGEEAVPSIGPERGKALEGHCAAALEGTKYAKRGVLEIARHVLRTPELQDLGDLTEEEAKAFLAKCRAEGAKAQAA